jgi:8-oxo-dGTP pyrophosphatase MutT (NUDIX family)
MKNFHIDEPREIGKKKIRIKKDDVLLVKHAMEERKYTAILKQMMNESKDDTMHSVGILVFFKNQMLVAQRTSGKWSVPKGRIKQNEIPVEAIQREVTEELGFQLPKIPRKVKMFDKENGGKFHLFAVVLDRPETIYLNDEHQAMSWIQIKSNAEITLPQNFEEDLGQAIQDMFGSKNG